MRWLPFLLSASAALVFATSAAAQDAPRAAPSLAPQAPIQATVQAPIQATVQAPIQATANLDTVVLRGGERRMGRVVEIKAHDRVLMRVEGQADPVVFTWSEIERVELAAPAPPPPPTPPVPSQPPAPTPLESGPMIFVHLDAGGPAVLHRRPKGKRDFEVACQAPCDRFMPIGDTYRISGDGFTTSKDFQLEGRAGGAVTLGVRGPNWLGIAVGGTAALLGGATSYIGLLLASATASCSECGTLGLTMTLVGGAAIGGGIGLVLLSKGTDISQNASELRYREASHRDATTDRNASAWRPPAQFPLMLSGRF